MVNLFESKEVKAVKFKHTMKQNPFLRNFAFETIQFRMCPSPLRNERCRYLKEAQKLRPCFVSITTKHSSISSVDLRKHLHTHVLNLLQKKTLTQTQTFHLTAWVGLHKQPIFYQQTNESCSAMIHSLLPQYLYAFSRLWLLLRQDWLPNFYINTHKSERLHLLFKASLHPYHWSSKGLMQSFKLCLGGIVFILSLPLFGHLLPN